MLKDSLDPILSQVLTNVIQLGAVLLFSALGFLWKTLQQYLKSHLTAKQMEILQSIGNQAYALTEAEYRQLKGPEKLQQAMNYLQQEATSRGIPFNQDSARAAIEHAWLNFSGQFQSQGQSPTTQT